MVELTVCALPTLFHNSLMKEVPLVLSLYRRGNRCLKMLNNILKIIEPGKAGPSPNFGLFDVTAYVVNHSSGR